MGYGEKVKKWFFDEDGDGEDIAEDYDAVEVDTVPKTSLFEQAKLSKTSEAVKSLNMNKDSHLVLFEPRSFGETQDIANYLKTKKENTILYINNLINDSKTYKDNELLLGNNPNMDVDNEDVITLLKEKISYLESIVFTIDNYKQLDSKIDDIKNDANRIYNTFKSNNKDYIALGLDVLLNDLNNKYNLVDTTIDKTNYYNLNNISVLKDVVDNENNLVLLNAKI